MKKLCVLIIILLNSEPLFAPTLTKYQTEQQRSNMERITRLNELMSSSFSPENLMELIILLEMPSPDIIFKQAKLESAWFSSRVFKEGLNLFGMHLPRVRETTANSYIIADNGRKVAKYDTWIDSVLDMKLFIEYYEDLGYDPLNYYDFLIAIGYCEKDIYTNILKKMS